MREWPSGSASAKGLSREASAVAANHNGYQGLKVIE